MRKSRLALTARLPLLASTLAASLAVASGPFLNREDALRHAATGLAARHDLAEAGLRDTLAAWAWELGGWTGLDLLQGAMTALPVFLGLCLALLFLERLPNRSRAAGRWIFPAAVATVFAWGLWNAHTGRQSGLRDPRLLVPTELLSRAEHLDGRVFFDAQSLFHAPMFAPGKLEPGSTLEKTIRLSSRTADWRAEDRANPFSAVVLTGQNLQAVPLARLLESLPGWSLALADNHGLLFVRGQADRETAYPEASAKMFDSPRERAVYLAQAALVQQSAGKSENARRLLKEALKTDAKSPQVLVRSALFAAQEGRWRETLESAEAALARDPRSLQAAHLRALALFESGAVPQAADQINALAATLPGDTTILGLQARIARENNDPATEIQALEKLLALAERGGSPVGNLHALLGQAWARRGFPDQALQHLRSALENDPPPEQRKTLQETIDLIEQRSR